MPEQLQMSYVVIIAFHLFFHILRRQQNKFDICTLEHNLLHEFKKICSE